MHDTVIPGVRCIKFYDADVKTPSLYTPSLCVIVQGAKQVLLNNEIHRYEPSQYLAISVDLPVIGQITKATKQEPYLCLQIDLDTHIIGELMTSSNMVLPPDKSTNRGIFVGTADNSLMESLVRLASLLQTPEDASYLSPLIIREIHYRLLRGEYGSHVAQLAFAGSNLQRIAQAIHLLKTKYTEAIRIEALAEAAHMSPSSFHFHFKEVTNMSPLQYQKRLRLMEARNLMLMGSVNAANAAYQVGYESASQFSREYARTFGAPPAKDIERIRVAAA